MSITQIKEYGPVPAGIHRNMEAVFRPENFWIFSGAFRSLSCAFPSETGRKSPEIFRPEHCFYVPMTSGIFLQGPAFYPSISCRFLRDLVTGIFDLGTFERNFMGPNPLRVFLSMMTLISRQNMNKIGVDQLGQFPREYDNRVLPKFLHVYSYIIFVYSNDLCKILTGLYFIQYT